MERERYIPRGKMEDSARRRFDYSMFLARKLLEANDGALSLYTLYDRSSALQEFQEDKYIKMRDFNKGFKAEMVKEFPDYKNLGYIENDRRYNFLMEIAEIFGRTVITVDELNIIDEEVDDFYDSCFKDVYEAEERDLYIENLWHMDIDKVTNLDNLDTKDAPADEMER